MSALRFTGEVADLERLAAGPQEQVLGWRGVKACVTAAETSPQVGKCTI